MCMKIFGDSFGELVLMYDVKCNFIVRVIIYGFLWGVNCVEFKLILIRYFFGLFFV